MVHQTSKLSFLFLMVWVFIAQAQSEHVPIIALKIILPNGKLVTASQKEGKMITISFDGNHYGLIPKVQNGNKEVLVKVLEITSTDKGQIVKEIENLKLINGGKEVKGKLFKLQIEGVSAHAIQPLERKSNSNN